MKIMMMMMMMMMMMIIIIIISVIIGKITDVLKLNISPGCIQFYYILIVWW